MSTKSRARAIRRHPELADPKAVAAVGEAILTTVTLGMLEPDADVRSDPAPTQAQANVSAAAPASHR